MATELQDCILRYWSMTQDPATIAQECNCSKGYVTKTLNEFKPVGWDDDTLIGNF